MESERRAAPRKPVSWPVMLFYNRLGLVSARTRDISASGAYIVAPSVSFSTGENIELTFAGDAPRPIQKIRLRATIVRTDGEGAGLCFDEFHGDTRRLMRDILA
jgi:hypothetical protein